MSGRRDDRRVPPRPAPRAYGFTAAIRHDGGAATLEAAFARHLKAHLPDAPYGLGAWRLLPDDHGRDRRVAIEVTAADLATAEGSMWVLANSQGLRDHGLAIDRVRQAKLVDGVPVEVTDDPAPAVAETLAALHALVDGPLLDLAASGPAREAFLPDDVRGKLDALRLRLEEAALLAGLDVGSEPAEAPKPR